MTDCDKCKNDIARIAGICNPPIPPANRERNGVPPEKQCCGCPEPIQGVAALSEDEPWVYRFNYGGRSVWLDTKPGVEAAQTDTSLSIPTGTRSLLFQAERHTDTISASELGNILHVADLGDVDTSEVQDNSLFVHKVNAACPDGTCIGDSWGAWNANDNENRKTSAQTLMGFDADGTPVSVQPPANTNQYYDFGWNAQGQAGYTQPVAFASFPYDSSNYAYIACVDPRTLQQGYVKVLRGTPVVV